MRYVTNGTNLPEAAAGSRGPIRCLSTIPVFSTPCLPAGCSKVVQWHGVEVARLAYPKDAARSALQPHTTSLPSERAHKRLPNYRKT